MAGDGCIPVQICSCHQKGSLLWAAFVTLMNPQRVILETLKLYFIESSLQAAESHLLAELHLAALGRLSKNGPKSDFYSDQNSRKWQVASDQNFVMSVHSSY